MQNMQMLFSSNQSNILDGSIKKKLKYIHNKDFVGYSYNLKIREEIFCGDQLHEVLQVINYIEKKYHGQKIPIIFHAYNFRFYDKLVYILLECISYYMNIIKTQKCIFDLLPQSTIWSEGMLFTQLYYQDDIERFKKSFLNDLNGRHFRKVIYKDDKNEGTDLSKLFQDIRLFLIINGVPETNSLNLAEVLVELVGNSREHAHTDTLIDIDITETNYNKKDDNDVYYGMNTAILNFSPILFHEPLKKKMNSGTELKDKYLAVSQAYNFHKTKFSNIYGENEFYILSSFQDRVSGSLTKKMGGKGLTTLLNSLEEQADTHLCYMLSDNIVTFLMQDLLKHNKDNFVGFNSQANYLNQIPDERAFQKINTHMPGTAYNLSFAIKKEWSL